LYLIAQSAEQNQSLYERLNVKLRPEDNRGEAFYASSGDFRELVKEAEAGRLTKEFCAVMYGVVKKAPAALLE